VTHVPTQSQADREQRFRALCLELPETCEVSSWGHPNFRAGKQTFAALEWFKGRPSFAFRVGAECAPDFKRRHRLLFDTPYGRGQWLSIWMDGRLSWTLVRNLLEHSYRRVALKRMISALDQAPQRRSRS